MSKAAIQKKYQVSGKGIFIIDDGRVLIEDTERGVQVDIADLCADFADKDVTFSIASSEEY